MNLSVCMSVHVYLRQLWKSEDPEPTHAWTMCEIPVLQGSKVVVFVSVCVVLCGYNGACTRNRSGTAAQGHSAHSSSWGDWEAGASTGQTNCLS